MTKSFDTPEQAAARTELLAEAQAVIARYAGGPAALAKSQLDELLEGLTGQERRRVAGTAFFDAHGRLHVRRLRPVPAAPVRDAAGD